MIKIYLNLFMWKIGLGKAVRNWKEKEVGGNVGSALVSVGLADIVCFSPLYFNVSSTIIKCFF